MSSHTIAWVAWVVAVAVGPALDHIGKLRDLGVSLGPRAAIAFPAVAILLAAGALIADRWRWRRVELPLLAAVVTIPALFVAPIAAVVAIAFAAGCLLAGTAILHWLKLEAPLAISMLMGAAAMTSVWTAAALAGVMKPWVVAAIVIAPWLSRRALRDAALRIRQFDAAWRAEGSGAAWFVAVAAGGLAVATALLPPTAFDSVRDHLPAAWWIARTGSLTPLEVEPLTYFPLGFELIEAAAERLGGMAAAQLLPLIWFAALLGAGAAVARQWGASRVAVALGTAAAAAIPFLHWSGSVVKNDCLMSGYQLAALYAIGAARVRGSNRWLLAAAFFLAQSTGIKHTALLGAVPLAVLWIVGAIRNGAAIRTAAIALPLVAVAGFHWHARTALAMGGPLYPESATGRAAISANHAVESGGVLRYAKVFVDAQFRGSPGAFESDSANPLGLFIAVFLPLAFAARLTRAPLRTEAWIFVGVYFALWAASISTLRYAIAPVVLVFLLISERIAGWNVRAVYAAVGALSLTIAMTIEFGHKESLYWLGKMDGPSYLRTKIPMYAALEEANRRAEPGDWMLAVGNCARRYAVDPSRLACVFEENGYTTAELPLDLYLRPYRFLILPTRMAGALGLATVYRDKGFVLVVRE